MQAEVNLARTYPVLSSYRFTDLEHYAEMIRHNGVQLTRITSGEIPEELHVLELPDVLVRRSQQHVSWTCTAEALPGHYAFVIPWNISRPTIYNGIRMDGGIISMYRPGAEYYSSAGPCDYLYITVPIALFDQEMLTLRGWLPPKDPSFFSSSGAEAVQAIAQLVDRMIGSVARDAQATKARLRAMQQALITELALAMDRPGHERAHVDERGVSHQDIFKRALGFARAHIHEPIYMADLCRASGAGERLLRQVFKEFTMLSPVAFLNCMRLQHAHGILLMGVPGTMTVKFAALDSGFWDLGRFSVRYRTLFGESPSATLARAPQRA